MGDMSSGPGGVLYNTPSGPSGLFESLDPTYQARQQQVQQNAIGLDAAQAFKNGVPLDPRTGQPDFDAMSRTLMQKGDFGNAEKIQQLGISMQGLGIANQAASAFGGGGSLPAAAGSSAVDQTSGAPTKSAPTDYFGRLALVESGKNPNAPASGSSAFGKYRFTDSTWNGLSQEYPQLGLTPDGRSDPSQQQRAVQALTNDNASALGRAGYQPTPGNLRLAHFAGASGATSILGADPNAPVSSVLGAGAVKANPFLSKMTAGGLTAWANAQMSGVDPSSIPGSAPSAVASTGGDASPARPPVAVAAPAAPPSGGNPSGRPAPGSAVIGPDDPVPDSLYQTALKIVGQAQNADPRAMTQDQARGVTRAQELVDQYQKQQAAPPAAAAAAAPTGTQVAQNGTSDGPQPTGQHPFAPPPQASVVPPGSQPPTAVPQASAPAAPQQAPQNFGTGNTPLSNDPGVAGILRSYKQGAFAGDPGAALNDMRRMQIQLGAAGQYGTGPAAAIGKTADYLEQAITRSATLTNAQRDARDPAVMAQLQQKAQIEAQAKLRGETDPSRIGFAQNQAAAAAQGALDVSSSSQALRAAGQKAEAVAAGTQQGQNSPDAAAAAAAKAGQVAEAQKQGQYLGGMTAQYDKQAQAAQATNDNVDQMLTAAQGFRMGKGAPMQQDARKSLQTAFQALGVNSPTLNSETANYEDFGKVAGVLSRNVAGSLSGPTGVQELNLLNSTLPSPEMSYDGLRGVASSLKGSADYQVAKQQAANQWRQQNGTLTGFEADFAKNVTPSALWLHRLQVDQPDLFAHSIQQLQQTPQGKALIGKAAQGLQYLTAHGGGD